MDFVIFFTALLIVVILVTGGYAFTMGVPYVPTPRRVARAMVKAAKLRGKEHVFDLGAGTGTILIEAKRMHPTINATGVELVPTIWLWGKIKIFFSGQRFSFLRRDAFTVNLKKADVIFLYLMPSMLAKLEKKFNKELKKGTIVLSHGFSFPKRRPAETIDVAYGRKSKKILKYRW